MQNSERQSSILALALLATDGVGRVAAGRLIERFGTYANLAETPHEQILTRLPGIPKAGDLVKTILDPTFEDRLAAAEASVDRLASQKIALLTSHHSHWPEGLRQLDRSHRPVVLFVFGPTSVLRERLVAFLARPPLAGEAFERAQSLMRHLFEAGAVPVIGLQHGFDTVGCKLADGANRAAIAVTSSGLAKVPGSMRPAGAALARAGGLLVSPFPVDHGPFAHDDVERATLAAAMAQTTVFVGAPQKSPERRALEWALENRRLVVTTDENESGIEVLKEGDFDRVIAEERPES